MAVQKCPQCGYVLQPFESECPKCKTPAGTGTPKPINAAPEAPPASSSAPKGQPPAPAPARKPAPRAEGKNKPTQTSSEMQVCESCKGKYAADLPICPYCKHKSHLERHTRGAKISLEQERTIIGAVGGVLLVAACIFGFWVFKYQGEEIEYRVLGLKDFQLTVETRIPRPDGKGLRTAGVSTYWYKPGKLRLDLISAEDPVDRPLTRLAKLGEGQMYTVDTAAGICMEQSYSPEALQAPVVEAAATPGTEAVTKPAAWKPRSPLEPVFSLLGNYDPTYGSPPLQLVQAPAKTPAAQQSQVPQGPARNYKLENLGSEKINGFSTVHYRLTTSVSAKGCAGLADGQEVREYWIVPNLNGRFFEPQAEEARSSGASGGRDWEDERAAPTPTPDPSTAATPTPVPAPESGTPGPATAPTPLPVPTPYSPAVRIGALKPDLALTPNPADACAVDNLRSGDEADFQNLFNGLVLRLRLFKGKTLVMEQEVRKFKRLQLTDDVFDANRYLLLNANEFWARRAAPLPKATATPKPEVKPAETADPTPTASGTPAAGVTADMGPEPSNTSKPNDPADPAEAKENVAPAVPQPPPVDEVTRP